MVVVERNSFEKFLQAIAKTGVETNIEIEKNCIKSTTVDAGHIFMVMAKMPCVGSKDEKVTITISPEKTLKMLKLIKDDRLNLKINSKLWLNENIGIGLVDTVDTPKEPKLDFDISAKFVDLKRLREIVKTGMEISDNCKFIAKEKLFIEIEGDVDVIKFDVLEKVEGEGEAMFSIDLLYELLKGHLYMGNLMFGTNKPLRLEVMEDDVQIVYLLAPRIESD